MVPQLPPVLSVAVKGDFYTTPVIRSYVCGVTVLRLRQIVPTFEQEDQTLTEKVGEV